jgi:hypothetical protein
LRIVIRQGGRGQNAHAVLPHSSNPEKGNPMTHRLLSIAPIVVGAAILSACSGMGMKPMGSMAYSQASLPEAVKVPAGHVVAMETVGAGDITYECRAKAAMPGQYVGPPATWANMDGSKVTATQVAVAPNGPDNIPLQLVKANPAMGAGAMQGVTYIQRVATRGGVAPAMACGAAGVGQKQIVKYQADYIFYRAM